MSEVSQIEIRNITMQETSIIIIQLQNLPPHRLVQPDPEPAQLILAQSSASNAQLPQSQRHVRFSASSA